MGRDRLNEALSYGFRYFAQMARCVGVDTSIRRNPLDHRVEGHHKRDYPPPKKFLMPSGLVTLLKSKSCTPLPEKLMAPQNIWR